MQDIKPSAAELAKAVQARHLERVRGIAAQFSAPNLTESQIAARDAALRASTDQAARELRFLR